MFFSGRKARAEESKLNPTCHSKPLFRAYLHIPLCLSDVQAQYQWGGKYTPPMEIQGKGVSTCQILIYHILPPSVPFVLFLSIARLLEGALQMMSPVPYLLHSLHLTPVASAMTTPPSPVLSRSTMSSMLSTPMDVFPSSSYILHLPGCLSLFLGFLSLSGLRLPWGLVFPLHL